MNSRRKLVVILELSLVIIIIGMSYWWVRNTALAADSPLAAWLEPPTPTLDWRKVEDIWSLTPPPEWTPPPIPQAQYTPRPLEANDIPIVTHPTPTLLPEHGVKLDSPLELNVSQLRDNALQSPVEFLYPDFDGRVLVVVANYADYRSVLAIDVETQHVYSLVEESPVKGDNAWISNLKISGRYVIWTTSRPDDSNILYIYDLEKNKLTETTLVAYNIDFSSNLIVFQRPGQIDWGWDIWGYDLEQEQAFPIVQGPDFQGGAQISQDWMVYEEGAVQDTSGEVDLYALNLKTEQKVHLGKVYEASDHVVPPLYTVDAPWVVWGTPGKLNFYHLNTGEQSIVEVEACIPGERPGYLELEGNTVIFSCGQWLGYDLEHQVFFSIPIRSVPDGLNMNWREWAFSNQRVAWIMTGSGTYRQADNRIFVASIEYVP